MAEVEEETCRFEGPGENGVVWFHCRCETGEWKMTNMGCPDPQGLKDAMISFLEQSDYGERPSDWRDDIDQSPGYNQHDDPGDFGGEAPPS
jgi:hypothetical protein